MHERTTYALVIPLVAPVCRALRLRLLPFLSCLLFGWCAPAADSVPTTNQVDLTQVPIEKLMEMEVPSVYSASKFEQRTTEAPASITIVTADEVKRYGYRTLGDILESVPGLYVSYDRNYQFLGVRGISLGDFNSRTLLLVDGHRVNNNLTDGAYIDTAFILDVDLIDRVEVIKGPSSVLYGNNAFLGVINVITRKPGQLNGFEVSGEYGALDTFKGRVSFGKTFTNGISLLLSGTLYDSQGEERLFFPEFNTPAQNFGVAQDLDADSYGSFFGALGYSDFTLEGAFISRTKDNPTAQYFTTFNAPGLRTVDDRSYVNLKFEHDFPDILNVTARAYYDNAGFRIGYPFGEPTPTVFFKETEEGQWWGTELQLSKRILDKHMVTAGAEYRDDFEQEDHLFDANTGQTFVQSERSRRSYGFYAEGEFELLPKLQANGGVRYDKYGDFDPKVDPRVALIYSPFEQSTFKAIYGTAFRVPNFLELSDPRFQDIRPEEISSYELVYEQGIGHHLRSSLAGFFNDMEHLIVFQNGAFTNIDVQTRGLEVALEAFWTNSIRARLSYTLQRSENRSQDQSLPDSPEHLVKLNISVPVFTEKVLAGLEVQYTSARATYFTTTTGQTFPGTEAPGFTTVNFTLFSHDIVPNLELSASIYNLFDQRFFYPASRFHVQDQIEANGRTFRVKLTYRF